MRLDRQKAHWSNSTRQTRGNPSPNHSNAPIRSLTQPHIATINHKQPHTATHSHRHRIGKGAARCRGWFHLATKAPCEPPTVPASHAVHTCQHPYPPCLWPHNSKPSPPPTPVLSCPVPSEPLAHRHSQGPCPVLLVLTTHRTVAQHTHGAVSYLWQVAAQVFL